MQSSGEVEQRIDDESKSAPEIHVRRVPEKVPGWEVVRGARGKVQTGKRKEFETEKMMGVTEDENEPWGNENLEENLMK